MKKIRFRVIWIWFAISKLGNINFLKEFKIKIIILCKTSIIELIELSNLKNNFIENLRNGSNCWKF